MARRAFTLIELLITISIIALMAGMVLVATFAASEQAKAHKTRALIAKLDAVVKAKWEAYRTRRIPVDIGPDRFNDADGDGTFSAGDSWIIDHTGNGVFDGQARSGPQPNDPTRYSVAKLRIDALRDLMRMEMPERWTDVYRDPVAPLEYSAANKIARPAVSQAYLRKLQSVVGTAPPAMWPPEVMENQGAECLYLVIMSSPQEDGDDVREVFKAGDYGDTDGDGFLEFLDAWGKPIKFLRWPGGFVSELQALASGTIVARNPSTNSVTIDIDNVAFSREQGAYLGGVVAKYDGSDPAAADCANGARISSATVLANGHLNITCTTPGYTMQQPFNGQLPSPQGSIVIFAPDPFDPTGVYPQYSTTSNPPTPDTSITTYATYPLIYSAGPDKEYGVVSDSDIAMVDYVANKLYPFVKNGSGLLMGAQSVLNGESDGAWRDNIHNHLQATK